MNLQSFLQNPKHIKETKIDWNQFILLIFLYFLVVTIISIPMSGIAHLLDAKHFTSGLSVNEMLIRAVIFAPIIEECLFRLLLRPKLNNLILFSLLMLPSTLYLLFKGNYITFTIISSIELAILITILRNTYLLKLQKCIIKYFRFFFYFSILSFGFVHITNFTFPEISFWVIICTPLLVSPQIFMGSILGFIRMKYGFLYSVLLHTTINGVVTLGFALASLN